MLDRLADYPVQRRVGKVKRDQVEDTLAQSIVEEGVAPSIKQLGDNLNPRLTLLDSEVKRGLKSIGQPVLLYTRVFDQNLNGDLVTTHRRYVKRCATRRVDCVSVRTFLKDELYELAVFRLFQVERDSAEHRHASVSDGLVYGEIILQYLLNFEFVACLDTVH